MAKNEKKNQKILWSDNAKNDVISKKAVTPENTQK